jgi:hypothetical protein
MFLRQKKQFKNLYRGDKRVGLWSQQKLVYIRIPKSGNSSIMAALGGATKARMSAPEILRLDDSWTAFSFVRNPWSRLVSAFTQKAGDSPTSARVVDGVYQGFIDQGIPIRANMSFEEFCEVVCDIPDGKTDKHLCSQSSFLIYKKKPIVPFIGKIEQMAEDWSRLLQQAGLDGELPHINRTGKKGRHYSHFYKDEAIVKLVGDRYADDIRYFNYEFKRQ